MADVWDARGWNTRATRNSADRGVDVVAIQQTPFRRKHIIQAKRYSDSNPVGSPEVQQYASLRQQEDADAVIIVTSGRFSEQAESVARDLNVKLVDGDDLYDLISSNGFSSITDKYLDSGDGHSSEPSSKTTPQQSQKFIDSPDDKSSHVSISIVGIEKINAGYESRLTYNKPISGVGVAAHMMVTDVADQVWLPIDDRSELIMVLRDKNLTPYKLSEDPLATGWQTHDPSVRNNLGARDLNVEIRIDHAAQCFAIFNTKIKKIKKIEIPRYGISVDLEDRPEALRGLPPRLNTSLQSVRNVRIGVDKP